MHVAVLLYHGFGYLKFDCNLSKVPESWKNTYSFGLTAASCGVLHVCKTMHACGDGVLYILTSVSL